MARSVGVGGGVPWDPPQILVNSNGKIPCLVSEIALEVLSPSVPFLWESRVSGTVLWVQFRSFPHSGAFMAPADGPHFLDGGTEAQGD